MKKNFLIIAAVAVAISASAFTNNHKFTSSQWVFTGNQNQILDHTKYSQSAMEPSGCGFGEAVPCKVELPESVDNQTALENYLQSGVSEQDIIDQAITLRD